MKWILCTILAGLLIPCGGTLLWRSGMAEQEIGEIEAGGAAGQEERKILLDRGGEPQEVLMEEYLPGVVAAQLSPPLEYEAVKAQAILARTYICRQMEAYGERSVPESALDLDWREEDLEEVLLRGEDWELYRQAVEDTRGQTLTCDGSWIWPLYFPVSSGKTRGEKEGYPYLKEAACSADCEAEGFASEVFFTQKEFAEAVNQIPGSRGENRTISPGEILEQTQIAGRDAAGYVTEIQIGGAVFSGEEIRQALRLPSAAFELKPWKGGIRAKVKGIGHGYGLSQAQAAELAEEGWDAEEILLYFYKNVALVSE